ncbi:competence protein ComJ [Aurantimonas endophytica]|uniref:Competence protein J (ComJ) n=1 Tax=Aurantimonas endophytica TaxID=1522175 RepID=A0A7W6MS13_9HYPH|nr:competence protein ComJ [Aurantimonas endophytica]MBB4005553.1 hypothetical protein [Aurantimonas endophytica]MCO6406477.1 hypothetical protein [Aurantimonas endophytica]
MLANFLMTVLYTQITVATPPGPIPALLWTDDHVAQGFAWSPGFVSFGIPDHDGDVRVSVLRDVAFGIDAGTLWAVQTPIKVVGPGIEVGTVGYEHAVAVPPGHYNLVFEARHPEAGEVEEVAYAVRLHFIETSSPTFAILKTGEDVTAERVLSETAEIIRDRLGSG